MANRNQLRKNNRARTELIRDGEQRLLRRDKKLQRALFRAVLGSLQQLDISGGAIANTTANIDKFNEMAVVDKFFEDTATPELLKTFRYVFTRLDGQAKRFFSTFQTSDFDTQEGIALQKMEQVKKRFLDTLAQDTAVQRKIKAKVLSAILSNANVLELREDLQEFIIGIPEGSNRKLGVIENNHFVQTKANEEFAIYDRAVNDTFADRMNLNYCVYQGGRINTTRDFCEERNAGVFTREEVLSWQNLDWQGKKQNHNILLDCGGYNCRHFYDWISYELARQLRPSIPKSQFDR